MEIIVIMPATELLCRLARIQPSDLSKDENIIIEAELFARVCEQLKETFKDKYKDYFRVIKLNKDMEKVMMEDSFTRCIINDILATEEYTLSGIALYTQTPEDIVYELASGTITNPTIVFFRKIIELHRSVRVDLYNAIMEKIITEYSLPRQSQ
jgi:hypothetical protein